MPSTGIPNKRLLRNILSRYFDFLPVLRKQREDVFHGQVNNDREITR